MFLHRAIAEQVKIKSIAELSLLYAYSKFGSKCARFKCKLDRMPKFLVAPQSFRSVCVLHIRQLFMIGSTMQFKGCTDTSDVG